MQTASEGIGEWEYKARDPVDSQQFQNKHHIGAPLCRLRYEWKRVYCLVELSKSILKVLCESEYICEPVAKTNPSDLNRIIWWHPQDVCFGLSPPLGDADDDSCVRNATVITNN